MFFFSNRSGRLNISLDQHPRDPARLDDRPHCEAEVERGTNGKAQLRNVCFSAEPRIKRTC
jgi:hypothetical protein